MSHSLTKNSLLVSCVLGTSTILGFIRESAVAYKFGATQLTDAYLIAMLVPNLFIALIMGTLTNTFISVYSCYLAQGYPQKAENTANALLSVFILGLAGLALLFIIFAPFFVRLVAPGYSQAIQVLTVRLMAILLPSIAFSGITGVLVGINNAHHSFVAPAMIGVASNVITILGIVLLSGPLGIYGLALGWTVGIIAQFLIQIPAVRKHGFKLRFLPTWKDPGLLEILQLVFPLVLSAGANQVKLIIVRALAAAMPVGTITSLYFANKLVFLPQQVFSGAIGMVVLPMVTKAAARGDWKAMREGLLRSLRLVTIVLGPAAVGIFVLRVPLVKLLFEHGAFLPDDTAATAGLIPYFLGALIFSSLAMMLTNAYCALKKIKFAVGANIIAVGANIIFSLWLSKPLQQKGLALAATFSDLVNLVLLALGFIVFMRKQEKLKSALPELAAFCARVAAAVVMMALAVSLYLRAVPMDMLGRSNLLLLISGGVFLGLIVYVSAMYAFRIEEFRLLLKEGD